MFATADVKNSFAPALSDSNTLPVSAKVSLNTPNASKRPFPIATIPTTIATSVPAVAAALSPIIPPSVASPVEIAPNADARLVATFTNLEIAKPPTIAVRVVISTVYSSNKFPNSLNDGSIKKAFILSHTSLCRNFTNKGITASFASKPSVRPGTPVSSLPKFVNAVPIESFKPPTASKSFLALLFSSLFCSSSAAAGSSGFSVATVRPSIAVFRSPSILV